MTTASRITDERLTSLYEADGFGGERTMRAKVIRELIDEIRALRQALGQAEALRPHTDPKSEGTFRPR